MESKCAFCKTWTYVYDPFRGTVRARLRTDFEAVVLRTWMVYVKGKVWVVVAPYKENPATILVYNADPPRLIQETSELVAKYPELSSGVIDLRLENDPPRIVLNTRDGRSGLILALGDEKLYANDVAYRKTLPEADGQQMTVLALGRVDNGPRRRLYRVTGPRNRVTESSLEFALMNPSTLMGANKVTVEALSPERDYIEGVLFLQDLDGGLILHQDAAGIGQPPAHPCGQQRKGKMDDHAGRFLQGAQSGHRPRRDVRDLLHEEPCRRVPHRQPRSAAARGRGGDRLRLRDGPQAVGDQALVVGLAEDTLVAEVLAAAEILVDGTAKSHLIRRVGTIERMTWE